MSMGMTAPLSTSTVGTTIQTAEIDDGAVTSAKIADGAIVDADVNASAALAISKLNQPTIHSSFTFPYAWPGTGTGVTNNLLYIVSINVPWKTTLTGIRWIVNSAAVTGIRIALWSADGQTRLATRATDSVPSGTFAMQQTPFDASYVASPGLYLVGIVMTGGNILASTVLNNATSVANGSMTIPATVTAPTSAGLGNTNTPVFCTY